MSFLVGSGIEGTRVGAAGGGCRRTYSVPLTNTKAVDDNEGGPTGQNPTSVNCIMIMHASMVTTLVESLWSLAVANRSSIVEKGCDGYRGNPDRT